MSDYDFYDEPSEFEMQIEEFKQGLMRAVKQEILDEMESLREENRELQTFKREKDQMKREHRDALVDLQIKANDAEKKANRKKLVELFGEYLTVAWGVKDNHIYPPKCDKCDDQRHIHFKSPSGKNLTEKCDCDKPKHSYVPQELSLVRFYAMRKDRAGKEDYVERHYSKTSRLFSDNDEYEDASNIYNGEEFANVRRWEIVFLDKAKCQEYCDWFNSKTKEG